MRKLFFLSVFFITIHALFSQSVNDLQTLKSLKEHLYYLASDKLEGRATGSEGEKKAGDYIIKQYQTIGLQPMGENGNYRQQFTFAAGKEYGKNNRLLVAAFKTKFNFKNPGKEFFPLEYSSNGQAKGDLIFVNYGITAPAANYDDYKELKNLQGAILLMEISSPDGMHPHSKYAEFSDIRSKIDLAVSKGAVGIVFINSDSTVDDPTEKKFDNKITPSKIPIVFLKKEKAAELKTAEKIQIGNSVGSVEIFVELNTIHKKGNNIIGFMDNGKTHTIVIGAHYDHLGYGEQGGSLYRGNKSIHNGADDNASGTAILIELSRALKNSSEKNNNYLFIAFSGEELGLYGSNHFVKNPTVKMESINYMLNMDMVGRLDKSKGLAVNGVGTSPVWKNLVNNIFIDSIKIKTSESGVGPSDQTSFYLQNIPVLHFFSGTHEDYHKPSDDPEKINFSGMVSIKNFILSVIDSLNENGKLTFSKTKEDSSENAPKFTVTLGVIPDYLFDGEGMRIDGVTEGKPAQKAGIQKGDVVINMGEVKVMDMMSYMKGLSKYKKGDSVKVKVLREGREIEFLVTF